MSVPGVRIGFTGHDEDDELGLVNMRGRLYDPKQRRFISPDPFVSDPLDGQSHNRYAYVLNNPLNLIDPSGFISISGNASPGVIGFSPFISIGTQTSGDPVPPSEMPFIVVYPNGTPPTQPAPATPPRTAGGPPKATPIWTPSDSFSSYSGGSGQPPGAAGPSHSAPLVTVTDLGTIHVPRTPPAPEKNVSPVRALASAGLGFIPYLGFLQSLLELLAGWDYLAGEPVSRPLAAIEVLASIIPGGKGLVKALSKGDDVADLVRLRHYTNTKGIDAIEQERVLRAKDQGKVFFDKASGKPLSPRDAEAEFGLKRGRGSHVVETDVPCERVTRVWNQVMETWEYQVKGDVPLINPEFIRR